MQTSRIPHSQGLTAPADGVFDFDIAAQPLAVALHQYGEISGQPALFDASMLAGRISSAVQGRFTAGQALSQLLARTGLKAERLSSEYGETYVLKAIAAAESPSVVGMLERLRANAYAARIQQSILRTFCADARTAPGNYGALFRFQLDSEGQVFAPRVLDGSGDAQRDALLLAALRGLQLGSAPPAEVVQQPLTMLLVPDEPGAASCGSLPGGH
ncbi:MAG: STN domain-containing protein [Acidovorax sp.]|jgi:hypothetical protein|nr:STN domain-containing protein [Acidovorax sp.]